MSFMCHKIVEQTFLQFYQADGRSLPHQTYHHLLPHRQPKLSMGRKFSSKRAREHNPTSSKPISAFSSIHVLFFCFYQKTIDDSYTSYFVKYSLTKTWASSNCHFFRSSHESSHLKVKNPPVVKDWKTANGNFELSLNISPPSRSVQF